MGYHEKAKELSRKITPDYIAEGNVTHDDIQSLRDCVVFLLGEYRTLANSAKSKRIALSKISNLVDGEI